VVQLLENFDLATDSLDILLVLDFGLFEYFDCDLLACENMCAKFDLSKSAFT